MKELANVLQKANSYDEWCDVNESEIRAYISEHGYDRELDWNEEEFYNELYELCQ